MKLHFPWHKKAPVIERDSMLPRRPRRPRRNLGREIEELRNHLETLERKLDQEILVGNRDFSRMKSSLTMLDKSFEILGGMVREHAAKCMHAKLLEKEPFHGPPSEAV